ncbi:hypothetical protein DERP_000423, partial [Dermatophagoides pteronyssinus]
WQYDSIFLNFFSQIISQKKSERLIAYVLSLFSFVFFSRLNNKSLMDTSLYGFYAHGNPIEFFICDSN